MVLATNCLVPVITNPEMIPTANDTKWNELLAPAPLGIATLSQLLICASRTTDFEINKIEKEKIPLMKHSESFRTTLVQITNEAYNAFMKGHINMEKIELQVAQVPDYVKDCVKIIKTNNPIAIEKFVPRRLERIKEAAVDGQTLSEEVCKGFSDLGELIEQVLLAISKSKGVKEKEFEDGIKAKIEEEKKRREEAKKKEQENLEKELEEATKIAQESKQYMNAVRRRRLNFLEKFLLGESKEKSLEYAKEMVEEAEKLMDKTKKDAKQAEEDMEKINADCIESLKKMKIDVKQEISTDDMIKLLTKGMELLGDLKSKWTGMNLYFQSINSYITKYFGQKTMDFYNDAKDAQTNNFLIDFMTDTITNSLQSAIKSHYTASTYVKVSNNYIKKPLSDMYTMLAVETGKLEEVQKELIDSCTKASEGIHTIFIENSEKMIREMDSAKTDQVQSIEN